jgi:hypothetical protein
LNSVIASERGALNAEWVLCPRSAFADHAPQTGQSAIGPQGDEEVWLYGRRITLCIRKPVIPMKPPFDIATVR